MKSTKSTSIKKQLLVWKPIENFAGEFEAYIGPLEFSVSDEGHWAVDFVKSTQFLRRAYISIESGRTISLKRAKMKCEQFARTLHTAFNKLENRNGNK